jgi:hypothetical protein
MQVVTLLSLSSNVLHVSYWIRKDEQEQRLQSKQAHHSHLFVIGLVIQS